MDTMELTEFEKEALELMLSDAGVSERLKYQIDFAEVKGRDHTGVGVFVELQVPDKLAIPDKRRQTVSNLCGEMEGLINGFGGVLFVEDGKIQTLEFFTFEEPWPENIRHFKLRLTRDD